MEFKTPDFWYKDGLSPMAEVLRPFSLLYALGHWAHQKFSSAYKASKPVICVGNLTAGGSGKTPTVLALMSLIKKHKISSAPYFLTRGYGGDEDKLLQRYGPVVINKDRAQGAKDAIEHGADVILMDDGLQNPGLHKDLKFVVIDGSMGFGNGYMLPAGPLRTPLRTGLQNADAFILIGEDKCHIRPKLPQGVPCFQAHTVPSAATPPKDRPYVAFAGLAYPEKFFHFLRETLELNLSETIAFADHHAYTQEELEQLDQIAGELNADLITTEKDAVKLPEIEDIQVQVLPIKLAWTNEEDLVEFLKNKIAAL